jgi:hypothetical protein
MTARPGTTVADLSIIYEEFYQINDMVLFLYTEGHPQGFHDFVP